MSNVRVYTLLDESALVRMMRPSAAAAAVVRAIRRDREKRGWAVRQPRYATGGIVGNPAATRWRRPTILRLYIHRLGLWLCRY